MEEALWESLRSLPPKDAIVAFVWTDIVGLDEGARGGACWIDEKSTLDILTLTEKV